MISNSLQALLYGLTTRSDVKVLSTPTITAANNVPSLITIGQNVPYVSSASAATAESAEVQTITYQNVAITLNVTPHLTMASDSIGLERQPDDK